MEFGNEESFFPITAEDKQALAVSKRILEKVRLYGSYQYEPGIQVEEFFDLDFNMRRIAFEAEVWAEKLATDTYKGSEMVTIPASWWQHFKETYQNSWWLPLVVWGRRRDVKYTKTWVTTTVQVDRYLSYPGAVIDSDKLGRAVIHEIVREKR